MTNTWLVFKDSLPITAFRKGKSLKQHFVTSSFKSATRRLLPTIKALDTVSERAVIRVCLLWKSMRSLDHPTFFTWKMVLPAYQKMWFTLSDAKAAKWFTWVRLIADWVTASLNINKASPMEKTAHRWAFSTGRPSHTRYAGYCSAWNVFRGKQRQFLNRGSSIFLELPVPLEWM